MERWIPVFWILGLGIAAFVLIMLMDFLKERLKKRGDEAPNLKDESRTVY